MEGNSGAHTINEKTVRFSMRCLKMADGSCAPAGCRQPRRVRPMVPGHHPHDGPGDQRGVNRMRSGDLVAYQKRRQAKAMQRKEYLELDVSFGRMIGR